MFFFLFLIKLHTFFKMFHDEFFEASKNSCHETSKKKHLKKCFSMCLKTMSYVMRVTAVIDMHFYPCIQDIIETTGLFKSNYNSSKPHYWTIMANWPHRDQLLECCRGCLRSLKCTYELIKTRHGGRGENTLGRFKTGFSPPDVSLSEYVMQYLIFLSKVVSMKSKD